MSQGHLSGYPITAKLAEKRVGCVGLGAVGSVMALARPRGGGGAFMLCAPDTLRPGNIVRHALALLSVGQYKAEAVESALAAINPFVTSGSETENLTNPDVITTRLRDA